MSALSVYQAVYLLQSARVQAVGGARETLRLLLRRCRALGPELLSGSRKLWLPHHKSARRAP